MRQIEHLMITCHTNQLLDNHNNMGAPPMINQGQGQQQYPHIPNSIINHNRLTHINNNSTNNNHKGTTLNDDVSLMRMLLMNNFDPQASLN